jgi:hypothetical protein
LFETLAGRYGKYSETQKEIFFETFFWRIDKTNQVSMKTATHLIVVEYLDLTAHEWSKKKSPSREKKAGATQKTRALSFDEPTA